MLGISYQTNDEGERIYEGNLVDFVLGANMRIKGLLERVNIRHLGIKIDNRWYSLRRMGLKIQVNRDAQTEEPYMEVSYQNV